MREGVFAVLVRECAAVPLLRDLRRNDLLLMKFIQRLSINDMVFWDIVHTQVIARLDCSIRIAILLLVLIVIDNRMSKLDYGFGLSIQFFPFSPNPQSHHYYQFFVKIY